ncbi:MAG: serine--tRNA ligase [bacterium]|nr:serine--tRNA ligase [bacterium]
MIDIKFIRENAEKVKAALNRRGVDVDLESVLKLDEEKRSLMQEVETLRFTRNTLADAIAKLPEKERAKKISEGKSVREKLGQLDGKLHILNQALQTKLLELPNLPADDVPDGGEDAKEIIRTVGEIPTFSFQPKDHVDLGLGLDILDIDRAAKVSGTRFVYLKGDAVLLEFALVQFVMQKLVKEGLTPVVPPVLIRQSITNDLGYWQAGGNENYYLVHDADESDEKNPLYLVGTGEHAVVPMHKNEVLTDLPKRYVAFSSCFRREAGTYGKDTAGILRVHQFDKVEMISLVEPEDDTSEHARMLSLAEGLMHDLQLPYRVVKLAASDMGFPSAKTVDIETWLPGQNQYRETHSISTTTDFQARRLNIKYKKKDTTGFVHILNGTALAIGRTIIAVLENYQEVDGSVRVPDVLRPWVGKDVLQKTS